MFSTCSARSACAFFSLQRPTMGVFGFQAAVLTAQVPYKPPISCPLGQCIRRANRSVRRPSGREKKKCRGDLARA